MIKVIEDGQYLVELEAVWLERGNGKWEARRCCDVLLKTLIGLLMTTCLKSDESHNFLMIVKQDNNRKQAKNKNKAC